LRLGDDLWSRTRALHQLRNDLARGYVCLLMADGGAGSSVRVPFFRGRVTVGLGPFALARLARCPALPVFVVGLDRLRPFRVELGAPLPAGAATATPPVVAAFAFPRILEALVRRYPGHLYYHEEVAEAAAARPIDAAAP